jgi:hypothetical protein
MVEMRVTAKEIGVDGFARPGEVLAQQPQPGSSIEDDQLLTTAHFNARGVASITHRVWARAGNAAADSPKTN